MFAHIFLLSWFSFASGLYDGDAFNSDMSMSYGEEEQPGEDMTMTKEMKHHGIIPQVISHGPDLYCKFSFTRLDAEVGGVYSRALLQEHPSHVHWQNKRKKLFSLILTEVYSPDLLDMVNNTQRHKWLVSNIPKDKWMNGTTILEYEPPGNLKLLEYYTYILLVFHHPDPLNIKLEEINRKNVSRESFTLQEFMDRYDFTKAHAGNFFFLYDVVDNF